MHQKSRIVASVSLLLGFTALALFASTASSATDTKVLLVFEAEEMQLEAPMRAVNHPTASGGRAILVPEGSGPRGSARIELDLPLAGEYYVHAITLAELPSDDSFWISFDGQNRHLWDLPNKLEWSWHTVTNRFEPGPSSFRLDAGPHTLEVAGREDGAWIDRILVTNDPRHLPGVISISDIDPAWSGASIHFDVVENGGRQFVAFYDADRVMTVASRSLGAEEWVFVRLPSQALWDSHDYVTLAVDRAGHVHVAGNMHNDPLVYFRTTTPFDISTLIRVDHMTGANEREVTYPRFLDGPDGGLVFSYRNGSSGNGRTYFNRYDEATRSWSRLLDQPLFSSDPGRSTSSYPTLPTWNDGYYHLAWVWRDSPDSATTHDVCYARSRDLVEWETSTGSPLSLPLTPSRAEVVDPIPTHGGLLNGNLKLNFDHGDRPILSYHKYDENGNTQIYNARLEAEGWRIYRTSSWSERWEIGGRGVLSFSVVVGEIRRGPEGKIFQDFSHWEEGSGTWSLDPETLVPINSTPRTPSIPTALLNPENPDLKVLFHFAEGSGDRNSFLRWEALPKNGDLAPPFTPPPSSLRLYQLGHEEVSDRDRDGLPDEWELLHFHHLDQVGSEDPDQDGLSNFLEFHRGSDPLGSGSALDEHLILYLKFDESPGDQQVLDSSPQQVHGYLGDNPGADDADPGRDLDTPFNGTGSLRLDPTLHPQHASIPNPRGLFDLGEEKTIMAWVNPDRHQAWHALVCGDDFAYGLYLNRRGAPRAYLRYPTAQSSPSSSVSLPPSHWNHVALVVGTHGLTVYLNGRVLTNSAYEADVRPITSLLIGNDRYPGDAFHGRIDEVKIYDRALTPDEVAAEGIRTLDDPFAALDDPDLLLVLNLDETEGQTTKDETDHDHEAYLGAHPNPDPADPQWDPLLGVDGGSVRFRGESDHVTILNRDPSFDPDDAMTLSAWVRYEDIESWDPILAGDDYQFGLYLKPGGQIQAYFRNLSPRATSKSTVTLASRTWAHVALTKSGETVRLFVDGEMVSTSRHQGSLPPIEQFRLGFDGWTGARMNGWIDLVRVHRRALGPDEIVRLMRLSRP